ncbi:hypothetical protein J4E80_010388 [Alternaria sp. BMP 0032]|nr:hypothetical protein J4E80_010388 [Alternaria sp. BMP 0032]
MAGVEVAGLVFGVLPILFETVRAYSKVHDSLHTFRHWAEEVHNISFELRIQREVFFNECRLFLQKAVDAEAAKGMIRDRDDKRWESADLDKKLCVVLGENLELCASIITATKRIVVSMEEEMKRFNVVREQKGDVRACPTSLTFQSAAADHLQSEKLKSTIRRLHAEVQSEVCLNIAISCHEISTDASDTSAQEPPIWLYVQSMTTTSNNSLTTTPSSFSTLKASMSSALPPPGSANRLKHKASSELAQPSSNGKKAKQAPSNNASTALNLCLQTSICNYLKQTSMMCDASLARRCLGYLETPDSYKHMFFARHEKPKRPKYNTVHSVFDVMQQDVDDSILVEDQLKLAHKAALAILQYGNTPWLSEEWQSWRLHQLSYFGNYTNFNETSLETLHLSSRIITPVQPAVIAMEGIKPTAETSHEIKDGINSLPLFFLGVALLEIAHWKPIEKNMTGRDDNNQIYTARRLASGRAPLGPVYQRIAKKCLQCNFGVGTDLGKNDLRAAVYNDVVCELEDMIKQLSI